MFPIGDKNSHTQLISGNGTNIIGSQVFGKKIYADVGRSLTHTYFVGDLAVWVHNFCDFKIVNDSYLKQNGINAHELKKEIVGGSIARYDIYRNNVTGELVLMRKSGVGAPIETGEFIK